MTDKPYKIRQLTAGILHSYSQVFFSDKLLFSAILLIVSFFDFWAGFCGLLAIVASNLLAVHIGFDKVSIEKGLYGFNSLLVGLGLGIYFEPGLLLFLIIILASILTLFITVSLQGVIGKYGLPYLSIPFLIGIWTTFIAATKFQYLGISQRGIYTLNDLYIIGGSKLVNIYDWWNSIVFFQPLKIYFISLGAIFFQFNVLTGILISLGLLYYSRIAFSLSLIGFFTAYIFYQLIGANLSELNYSYIGFNYILTAIAVGGFFIIPSSRSYLWAILLTPIVAVLTISLNSFFSVFGLSIFSLPFNMMVLLFLYILKFRHEKNKGLSEVSFQQNIPEENLYAFSNYKQRFKYQNIVRFQLPFYGEWTVAQGHDGDITHQAEWKHAWDFVIKDSSDKQFRNQGDIVNDYYCFDKAVLSPADGVIHEVVDQIPDNKIGKINLEQNWGNTIIIKHSDGLYSSLNHLKTGSIIVKKGDHVKQGQKLAHAGNSGRSPYPHLHIQIQQTPYIGSHTIEYPFSNYALVEEKQNKLMFFEKPEVNQRVRNIEVNPLLKNTFDFIPGKEIQIELQNNGTDQKLKWYVDTDIHNNAFIKCMATGSRAFFFKDNHVFYFTHYKGERNTLLYYFYLAAFKISTGFNKNQEIEDLLPVNRTFSRGLLFIQDFFAPFVLLLKSRFKVVYADIDNEMSSSFIHLNSSVENYFIGKKTNGYHFSLSMKQSGEREFHVKNRNKEIKATWQD
jgi:urea transporter/murein DD-endopeptidase MepM/ murein hydrolase activator NlpD